MKKLVLNALIVAGFGLSLNMAYACGMGDGSSMGRAMRTSFGSDDEEVISGATLLGAAVCIYVLGNMYARHIDSTAHQAFDDELEHLTIVDGKEGLFNTILEKHHAKRSAISRSMKPYPFVLHVDDIDGFLTSIWWSRLWTTFQKKNKDLYKMQIFLDQLRKVIVTDYRYTKELQSMR